MLEFIGQLVRYIRRSTRATIPLLKPHEEVKKVAIIALTADRGLAGPSTPTSCAGRFDAGRHLQGRGRRQRPGASWAARAYSTVALPGLQAGQGLSGRHRPARRSSKPRPSPTGVIRRYTAESIDRVHLVYNRFKSAMEQYVTEQVVLPIQEELTSLVHPGGRRRAHGLHLRAVAGGHPRPTCCPPTSRSPSTGRSSRAWPASTARA